MKKREPPMMLLLGAAMMSNPEGWRGDSAYRTFSKEELVKLNRHFGFRITMRRDDSVRISSKWFPEGRKPKARTKARL